MASFIEGMMISSRRQKVFQVHGSAATFAKIRRRIQGPSGAPEISTTVYRSPSVVATIRIIGNGVCGLTQKVRKLLGTSWPLTSLKKEKPTQAKRWD